MKFQKTAVLVHGSHLESNINGQTWEDLNIGRVNGKPTLRGRLLMGVKVAKESEAEHIFYGSGVVDGDGKPESKHSIDATKRIEESLADILHFSSEEKAGFLTWLEDRAVPDMESLSTRDECRNTIDSCMEKGIDQLILVSSPWHIERCLVEAFTYTEILRASGKVPPDIFGTASHGSTEGVLVLEPSHRGDRPRTRWHELARLFFTVSEEKISEFEKQIELLASEYTKDRE